MMIIQDGILKSLTAADIDSAGVLRIPDGVTEISADVSLKSADLKELYLPETLCNTEVVAFAKCNRITTIQIPSWWRHFDMSGFYSLNLKNLLREQDGVLKKYNISMVNNRYYNIASVRNIAGIQVLKLCSLDFNDDGICSKPIIGIKRKSATVVRYNIEQALNMARTNAMRDRFKKALWEYCVSHNLSDDNINLSMILTNAMDKTINGWQADKIGRLHRANLDRYIQDIPKFVKGINRFQKKYINADLYGIFSELKQLNMDELADIVFPVKKRRNGPSATRVLKRRPCTNHHCRAMKDAGYKNPGAFPYEWLRGVDAKYRGILTAKLHDVFLRATIKMYTPAFCDSPRSRDVSNTVTLWLERKIFSLTGVQVRVSYQGCGFFSKTYKLHSPQGTYIWKIYHSNLAYETTKQYAHDVEVQNAFIVSGKKYHGKIKYRKILTGNISNQHGERYALYPFIDGNVGTVPNNPYDIFKPYQFCDRFGDDNMHGDTITDNGVLKMNESAFGNPWLVKIVNTILYRPWDDLAIVLNKYNSNQINQATQYINSRLTMSVPKYKTIQEKIIFLDRKLNSK